MIRVDVRANMREIEARLAAVREQIRGTATVRALNAAGAKMKSSGADEVKKIYTSLSLFKLRGYFRLQRASRGRLAVQINPKGGRIPLTFFSTLEWKQRGGGVSVVLGTETIFIPHAFIKKRGARMAVYLRAPDYHGQLYHKGTFRQQRVQRGGNDLPIAELFARSIPEVILRNGIDQTVVTIGEAKFADEFERQMKLLNIQVRANH